MESEVDAVFEKYADEAREEEMIKFAYYEVSSICKKEPRHIIVGTAKLYLERIAGKTGETPDLANLYLLRKTIRTFDEEEDLVEDLTREITNQIKRQSPPPDHKLPPSVIIAWAVFSVAALFYFFPVFGPHSN
jgi:hypothetical protein